MQQNNGGALYTVALKERLVLKQSVINIIKDYPVRSPQASKQKITVIENRRLLIRPIQ